jgi:phage FluMu gp28-like protein
MPISSANSLFPYELTRKAIDMNGKFLPFGRPGRKYYMGVDLSISAKGDYTVITIIEANADKKQIVKAMRFRDSAQYIMNTVKQLNSDFRPLKILIDKTGLGEVFYSELKKDMPNIYPQHFTYQEKYDMLMDLRREFEKLTIVIPNSKEDLQAYSFCEQLLRELNDFIMRADWKDPTRNVVRFSSGEFDDCVISLALANKVSIQSSGEVSIRAL